MNRWWLQHIAIIVVFCVFAGCAENAGSDNDDRPGDTGADPASGANTDAEPGDTGDTGTEPRVDTGADLGTGSDLDSGADIGSELEEKVCEAGELLATLPYDVTWFVIQDGRGFFVLNEEIKVVDLSDPAAPKEAGSLGKWTRPAAIAVKGNHAYITGPLDSGGEGLHVVEFDPENSFSYEVVGRVALPDWVFRVDLLGDYAVVQTGYISSAGALQIIDVSNPTAPQIVGAVETNLKGRVRMAVWENHVLVADGKLLIVDVSNPTAPTVVGELDEALEAYDVATSGSYAMVRGENSLHVVDLSSPSEPQIVSSLNIPDTGPIAVHENYVLTDDEKSVLYVIDVVDPRSPSIAAQIETQDDGKLYLQAYQGYAYLAWMGVAVVDFCSND